MEPSLNWLWGVVSLTLSGIITHLAGRIRENTKEISDLRVHIAEKYTPTEDLHGLVEALNEVRAELKQFRREFHDAQLTWVRNTKP